VLAEASLTLLEDVKCGVTNAEGKQGSSDEVRAGLLGVLITISLATEKSSAEAEDSAVPLETDAALFFIEVQPAPRLGGGFDSYSA
jgi:hypothetical protein